MSMMDRGQGSRRKLKGRCVVALWAPGLRPSPCDGGSQDRQPDRDASAGLGRVEGRWRRWAPGPSSGLGDLQVVLADVGGALGPSLSWLTRCHTWLTRQIGALGVEEQTWPGRASSQASKRPDVTRPRCWGGIRPPIFPRVGPRIDRTAGGP